MQTAGGLGSSDTLVLAQTMPRAMQVGVCVDGFNVYRGGPSSPARSGIELYRR
jgi:hypothetical protein